MSPDIKKPLLSISDRSGVTHKMLKHTIQRYKKFLTFPKKMQKKSRFFVVFESSNVFIYVQKQN